MIQANHNLYALLVGTGQVAVISGGTNQLIAKIKVGGFPLDIAYDPINQNLYVVCGESSILYVISGTTNIVIHQIPINNAPAAVIYNPADKNIWELDSGISIISSISERIIRTIALNLLANSLTYDPENQDVYVPSGTQSNAVTVISTSSRSIVVSIKVGKYPSSVTYGTNQNMYVTNTFSDTVSVISSKINRVIATVHVAPNPTLACFDPKDHSMYVVGNYGMLNGSETVSIIQPNRAVSIIKIGKLPTFAVYDSKNQDAYILNEHSPGLSVISSATHAVISRIDIGSGFSAVYDPSNNYVYVSSGNFLDVVSS